MRSIAPQRSSPPQRKKIFWQITTIFTSDYFFKSLTLATAVAKIRIQQRRSAPTRRKVMPTAPTRKTYRYTTIMTSTIKAAVDEISELKANAQRVLTDLDNLLAVEVFQMIDEIELLLCESRENLESNLSQIKSDLEKAHLLAR